MKQLNKSTFATKITQAKLEHITGYGGLAILAASSLLSLTPDGGSLNLSSYISGLGLNVFAGVIQQVFQAFASSKIHEAKRLECLAKKLETEVRKNPKLRVEIGTFLEKHRTYDIAEEIILGNPAAHGWLLLQIHQDQLAYQSDLNDLRISLQKTTKLLEELKIPTTLSTIPNQFRSFIMKRTDGFVGREFVFDEIHKFIRENLSGYFHISGFPGVGKSAILAEYVKRNGSIAHFNIQSQGITVSKLFLENICNQIIKRFSLPYTVQPDLLTDGQFLGQLLDEVTPQLSTEKPLIIVVDALDEVEWERKGNILYLPETLPNHAYFIVSSRPNIPNLKVHAPDIYKRFELREYSVQSAKDIQLYIQQAIRGSYNLRRWITTPSRALTYDGFVDLLTQKSENNFMYLRHVLPMIESGIYSDIDINELPLGLIGYYEDHWKRMGMQASPIPRRKLKIIYVLASLEKPASRKLISEFSQETDLVVQEILDTWKEFLEIHQSDIQFRYSIYHSSFREFLYRKDIVQAAGIAIKSINETILKSFLDELLDDE